MFLKPKGFRRSGLKIIVLSGWVRTSKIVDIAQDWPAVFGLKLGHLCLILFYRVDSECFSSYMSEIVKFLFKIVINTNDALYLPK